MINYRIETLWLYLEHLYRSLNCLNLNDKNVIVRMHDDTLENGSKRNYYNVLVLQPTYMDMYEQYKQLNETWNIWQGHCVLIKY